MALRCLPSCVHAGLTCRESFPEEVLALGFLSLQGQVESSFLAQFTQLLRVQGLQVFDGHVHFSEAGQKLCQEVLLLFCQHLGEIINGRIVMVKVILNIYW